MKHKKPYDKSVYRSLALISQFSINMLVPICMMTLLGWYLDQRLGTSYITIILFFIGAIAGAQGVYRLAKNIYGADEPQDRPAESVKSGRSIDLLSDTDGEARINSEQAVSKPKKTSGWKQE